MENQKKNEYDIQAAKSLVINTVRYLQTEHDIQAVLDLLTENNGTIPDTNENRQTFDRQFVSQGTLYNFNYFSVLILDCSARLAAVLDAVDRLLDPYGGTGSYGRENQHSNRFVGDELDQLRSINTTQIGRASCRERV